MGVKFSQNIIRDFAIYLFISLLIIPLLFGLYTAEYTIFGTYYLSFSLFILFLMPPLAIASTGLHSGDEKLFVIVLICTIIFYLIIYFGVFLLGRVIIKSLKKTRDLH